MESNVRVRCSFEERATLHAIAAEQNTTISGLVREMIPRYREFKNAQTVNIQQND
jgi:hypothetical protein